MATMFPCPNCNGQLIFSPKSGKLKCTSCGHYYKSADYKSPVKIEEAGMDTRIYICPNCAGEIQLIDNDGMEFCPYCGTQATMEEKFSKTGVPKYIIPFTIHKELAKEKYEKATKGIPFTPDGLNKDENINKMVGLYMPYYLYDFELHDSFEYRGEHIYALGDYEYTDRANVNLSYDVDHIQIPYDASQSLDDTISSQLEPFSMEDLREFNPNYLAGFYVENSTVDMELYLGESTEKAIDYLQQKTKKETCSYPLNSEEEKKINKELINKIKSNGAEGVYLPMYFLTTSYGDRVAYSVINGQTGKTYVDMPIDKRNLFRAGFITSIFIFIILYLSSFIASFSYDIKNLCVFAALVSSLIAYIGAKLAYKTYRFDNHLDDKGYFASRENLSKTMRVQSVEQKKSKSIKSVISNGLATLGVVGIALLFFAPIAFYYFVEALIVLLHFFKLTCYLASIVLVVLALISVKEGDKKVMSLGIISWGMALIVRLINLPNDFVYYGALIVVFAVIVISVKAIVDEYNRYATHPSPQFLKTGGGLNRA